MALRLTQTLVQAHLSDHIRAITFDATASTYGSLTGVMGCSIASNDSYQVCYLWKRMVLTEAAGGG